MRRRERVYETAVPISSAAPSIGANDCSGPVVGRLLTDVLLVLELVAPVGVLVLVDSVLGVVVLVVDGVDVLSLFD